MNTNRISLRTAEGQQVFSVAIKSLKKDREYILKLFAIKPEASHLVYRDRTYTASDIYRKG